MSDKKYDNFDDFLESVKSEEKPIHERRINRDDCGKLPIKLESRDNKVEIPVVKYNKFTKLFPKACIDWDIIRDLFGNGVTKYDKVMGVCMFLILAAVFNPFLIISYAFILGGSDGLTRLGILGGMFIFFCVSAFSVKANFWLPAMAVITVIKLFLEEGRTDSLIAVSMMLFIYLLFRMKINSIADS
jgi:hypothetical protein